MIRTQIYIPEEINNYLLTKAKRTRKTKAQVVREALEKDMEKSYQKTNLGTALLQLSKLKFRSGDKNFSKNIDKYLYEEA